MGNWWDVFWNDGDLNLDLILVPTGILFLAMYHIFLAFKIKIDPNSTVIGFENGNKKVWVRKMMEDMQTNVGTALSVLSSNASAATSMISLSVSLSSLIATVIGNGKSGSNEQSLIKTILYGDNSQLGMSIKYASLMLCFLVAFGAHVQSLRYFVHATFLMSTPDTAVPVQYVEIVVVKGSNFWNFGVRALYVSFPLLLWIFGPVPMFVCTLGLITVLYLTDTVTNPIPPFGTVTLSGRSKGKSPRLVSPPPGPSSVGDNVSPNLTQELGVVLFGARVATM